MNTPDHEYPDVLRRIERIESLIEYLCSRIEDHTIDLHNLDRRTEGWPVEIWEGECEDDDAN